MELQKAINERFSVRRFSPEKIDQDKLKKILEVTQHAPSACNYRSERIYVLQSESALAKANSICNCLYGAQTILLVCYDTEIARYRPWSDDTFGEIDATIACDEMMLMAWDLGIGSCWIGAFNPQSAREVFNLPENIMPMAMLPLGYIADGCEPAKELHGVSAPLEELVKYI